MPINYEYNCLNLLKFLESKNYTICLPVIKNNFQMNFHKYNSQNPLKVPSKVPLKSPLIVPSKVPSKVLSKVPLKVPLKVPPKVL